MPFDRRQAGAPRTGQTPRMSSRRRRVFAEIVCDPAAEWDRIGLYLPVAFGVGAAWYFLAGPDGLVGPALAVMAGCLVVAWRGRDRVGHLTAALLIAAVAAGFAHASWRAADAFTPAIAEVVAPGRIAGVIVAVDPRPAGAARWTLRLTDAGRPDRTAPPERISLLVPEPGAFLPGDHVAFRAILFPVSGPSAPGQYDFSFRDYFRQVGAGGRALSGPEALAPVRLGVGEAVAARIFRVRLAIAERIASTLDAPAAGFATALLTGLRQLLDEDVRDALRISGLGHILAISGLHMAIVAGGLFVTVRQVLAVIPGAASRLPVKSMAAIAALTGSTVYLLLSGAAVASQRAYVMIAIMFLAVLVGRPALTLRNVALAAWVVMLLAPETVMTASFQMSFAATIALVGGYRVLARRVSDVPRDASAGWRSVLATGPGRFVGGLVLTAVLAGLATGPIAAFHFGRIAPYGVLANVLAMPIVTMVVMPAGIVGLALMPLGLAAWPLAAMEVGLDMVASVASFVAGLSGSSVFVARPPPLALGALVMAPLALLVMARPPRLLLAGIAALGAAGVLFPEKPIALVNERASLVAVRNSAGRLSFPRNRGSGFVRETWLRADGDDRAPDEISLTEGVSCGALGCVVPMYRGGDDRSVAAVSFTPESLSEDCRRAALVVARYRVRPALRRICHATARRYAGRSVFLVDHADLEARGAHRIVLRDGELKAQTTRRPGALRPWQDRIRPGASAGPQ